MSEVSLKLEAQRSHCVKLGRLSLNCYGDPQDVGGVRIMEYLTRKVANREWYPHKREKCITVSKSGRSWKSEEHCDIRHEDAEFGVFSAGFQAYFAPVFCHYAPFPYILG